MFEFSPFDQEPEPQPAGNRFGPPRKHTAAALLDPSQFPSLRPKCFGCSQRLAIVDIGRHIVACDKVSAEDLARFKVALAEFEIDPGRAREVAETFINRFRASRRIDPRDDSL